MSWSQYNKKIDDVCEVIAGQSPKSTFYNKKGDGLPFYQGKKEFTDRFIGQPTTWTTKVTKEAYKDDILISVRAPVGPINISTQHICIGRGLAAIRASEQIDNDYLFYYLLKHESEIIGNAGAVFNSINKKQIGNIPIPIPPLHEQHQIVAILDQAFKAIDQAKANIEKNIENAKELFQSKLNQIFSQKGEGWEEKTLGEVAKYDKTKYVGNDRPYLGLEHIESNSGLFLGKLEPYSVRSSTFQFDQRHVLYGRLRPYLNKVLVPSFKGHCSTEIFPILPTIEVSREYLFFWFLAPITVSKIDATWTGARMPRANMNEVINFKLPIPSIDIQKQVSVKLSNLKASLEIVISQYEEQLLNIEELKKSILQKAFAGELTNKTVEV